MMQPAPSWTEIRAFDILEAAKRAGASVRKWRTADGPAKSTIHVCNDNLPKLADMDEYMPREEFLHPEDETPEIIGNWEIFNLYRTESHSYLKDDNGKHFDLQELINHDASR